MINLTLKLTLIGGEYFVELGDIVDFIDWLNKNHFDYRGLIEKGLAIEAPKDMYKNQQ